MLIADTSNSCDRCALKFVKSSDLNNHARDHVRPNPKWVIRKAKVQMRLKVSFEL